MRKIIFKLIFFCIFLSASFGFSQNLNSNNWEVRFTKGQQLLEQKKFDEAIIHLEESFEQASASINKNQQNYRELTYALASCYEKLETYPKSIEYFKKYLNLFGSEQGKQSNTYGEVLSELAIVYKKQGLYENALVSAKEAIEIIKNAKNFNNEKYALSLTNLCQIYDEIGEYELAIPIQLEALTQFEDHEKNNENYAGGLFTLAKLYGQISNYKKAIKLYEEVRLILGDNHPGTVATNNNLGQIFERLGDYEKALKLNLLALNKAEEGTFKYANRAQNVAYNYVKVGEYKKGLNYYNKALESCENSLGEEHKYYGRLLNNMGKLYYQINDFVRAEEFFYRSISNFLLNSTKDHAEYGYYLNDYAKTLFELGNEKEAIALMKENIEIAKRNSRTETEAYVNREFNLATALIKTRNYDEALPLLLNSNNKIKDILGNEHPDYGIMLRGLSDAYFGLGNVEKAMTSLEKSNNILINQIDEIFKFRSEAEKKAFLKTISNDFDKMQAIPIKNNLDEPRLNSINLNNQLMLKGLLLNNSKNVLESLENLQDSVIDTKINSYRYEKDKYAKVLTRNLSERTKSIDSLNEIINKKEAELVKIYSSSSIDEVSLYKDWKKIQRKLKSNEVAIEFSHFNISDHKQKDDIIYVAYIITSKTAYPKLITLFNESDLKNSFSKKSPNQLYKLRGSKAKSIGDTKELYDIIWKPIEKEVKNANKIYFSPSGLLNQIPFSALSIGEEFLGDKFNLIQLSSTDVLKAELSEPVMSSSLFIGGVDFGKGRTDANNDIAIDWKNLPGTLLEIERLQKLFKQNNIYYTSVVGVNATEESFKKLSENSPKILHIATHGFFNIKKQSIENNAFLQNSHDNPLLRSGLILAGANNVKRSNEDDGILTALEISNLNLSKTEIVVLSACETGLGDIDGNEGVYGLQRAFKMAGVEIIVMSLWQVPDKETAEFMDLFYQEWMTLNNVRVAFNNAQKSMQNKYKNEPLKWAAFVLFE